MHQLREVKELENSNQIFELSQAGKLFPECEVVETGKYFPYNYIYQDDRWGCAWRAIQLMLSAHLVEGCDDFKKVFESFARKESLMRIIGEKGMSKHLPLDRLKEAKWAPQENDKNWAEPFIGQIICQNYNLPTQLLLLNGYPAAYAPEQFFQSTIGFDEFWKIVKETIPSSPLMIDDATLALSIVGYYEEAEDRKHLILADPHIASNREFRATGIYRVVLDSKGNQLSYEFPDDKSKQKHYETYNKMEFGTKKWMVLRVLKDS